MTPIFPFSSWADIDVAEEAKRMGIRSDRALAYSKTGKGPDRMFSLTKDVVRAVCADDSFDNILDAFARDKRNK